MKVPVSCRCKPTAVLSVLWGTVPPARGKGGALSKWGGWFERKTSNEQKRKINPKSRILQKKIAFLPKKGIGEKAPTGLICGIETELLRKVAALSTPGQ